MKIVHKFLILIASLAIVQASFYGIQISNEKSILLSIKALLNQESIASNPYTITQNIESLESLDFIRCSKLMNKTSGIVYIDTSFKGMCETSFFELNGRLIETEIMAINGEIWQLNTVSNNSPEFQLLLWIVRVLTCFSGLLLYSIHQWRINFLLNLKNLEISKQEIELQSTKKINQIAAQVSHDIRSPLEALRMSLDRDDIPKDLIKLINGPLRRIDDIANDLLSQNKKLTNFISPTTTESLISIIESLIQEKIIQLKKTNIQIIFEPQSNDLFISKINVIEFCRAISNLLNNSIEALDKVGIIRVLLIRNEKNIQISIIDNGKGMSIEVLSKIGTRGFSQGKDHSNSGSGLGAFHAKEVIDSYGGKIEYLSTLGLGTNVNIYLPTVENQTTEQKFFHYVYIEDEELLRLAWQSKAKKKNIHLLVLESVKDFDTYKDQISKETTLIYIDSNMDNNKFSGEEFAIKLHNEGYKNLFIASGYDKSIFSSHSWLQYSGKKCPF